MVFECRYASMHHLLRGLVLVASLLSVPAFPQFAEARQSDDPATIQKTFPDENELTSHKHYINKDGKTIHSPAKSKSGDIPAGASAQCRDGSYSFSRHHSGTCSHHGGVSQWL